jgi:hypothetical protein
LLFNRFCARKLLKRGPGGIRTLGLRFRKPWRHRSSCSEQPIFSRIRYLSFGSEPPVRAQVCTLLCTSVWTRESRSNRTSFTLCQQKLKKTETIQLIREPRENHRQKLALMRAPAFLVVSQFSVRNFIQATLLQIEGEHAPGTHGLLADTPQSPYPRR